MIGINKAIELNNKDHELFYMNAILNNNFADYDNALENIKKAINLDSRNKEYYEFKENIEGNMGIAINPLLGAFFLGSKFDDFDLFGG